MHAWDQVGYLALVRPLKILEFVLSFSSYEASWFSVIPTTFCLKGFNWVYSPGRLISHLFLYARVPYTAC